MMPSDTVRELIQQLNQSLEEEIRKLQFVLNKRIGEINDEIARIQQEECEHNFINGVCEYCGLEQDNESAREDKK